MQIKKFGELSAQEELDKYMAGKVNYTPLMNVFYGGMRKSTKDKSVLSQFGDYIIKTVKPPPQNVRFMMDNEYPGGNKGQDFGSVGIFFICSDLSPKALWRMWGEPLFHDEFGEGFDENPDEEDEENEEEREITDNSYKGWSHGSYFMEIEGVKFHVGFDHRGTKMEVDPVTLNTECAKRRIPKEDMLLVCLKSVVDQ